MTPILTGKNSEVQEILTKIASARRQVRTLEKGGRELLYIAVAEACNLGAQLKENEEAWKHFIRDGPAWHGLKRPGPNAAKDAVRHVLRSIFAGTEQGDRNASLYWRAVKPMVERGCTSKKILKKLKKQGVRALAEATAKRLRSEPTSPARRKTIELKPNAFVAFPNGANFIRKSKLPYRTTLNAEVVSLDPVHIRVDGGGRIIRSSEVDEYDGD
ncbi:hypothetical protein ACCS67_33985 [Rhizobium brockwellii]|uniref:hypothetical protein n=1 Tax=Rhizobium brockwellii TaxID=3019932 RepID=UPI003F963D68